jgi:hypothetical protein
MFGWNFDLFLILNLRKRNNVFLNTYNRRSPLVNKKVYKSKPPLKVGEWPIEHGGKAYISFEEFVNIPGLENADIWIEFEKNNSIEEIVELVSRLKKSGFTFVVQK